MTNRSNMIPIAGRLHCVAEGNIGMGANEIYDDVREVTQDMLNVAILEEKTYTPTDYSGMGRVVLKKNIVEGVNTLTQDMFYKGAVGSRVPNTNTIFVIQYDYVLGEDITIPDNCVLKFDGGSISGGHTLTGNNTIIIANENKNVFDKNSLFSGTFEVEKASVKWFGAVGDGVTDDSDAIQKCIHFASNNSLNNIAYIPAGIFGISKSLYIYSDKGVHIKGDNNKSVVKAIASMDYMIGLELNGENHWYSDFSDFTLDGNRQGLSYYNNENGFIYTNVSLAKNGFYFRQEFRYGTFNNIIVQNVDEFCIYGITWATYVSHCTLKTSGFGVYAQIANGCHITNCNFAEIGYIGLIVQSGNPNITENIFDVCGRCCIVLGPSRNTVIKGNYFENASINGMKFCNYDISRPLSNTYHTVIVATGDDTGVYRNRETEYYTLAHTYNVYNATICDNYVDDDIAVNNKYFIIGSCLIESEIKNNCFNYGNYSAVVGTYLHSDATEISNVNISKNSFNTIPIPPIKEMEASDRLYMTVIDNVYSEDEPENPVYSCNLVNEFCVFNNSNNLLVEQVDIYKGFRVFKSISGTSVLYINPNDSNSNYSHVDVSLFTDKILYAVYYLKESGSSNWIREVQNGIGNVIISIPQDSEITIPQVYVAGCKHNDNREFTPITVMPRGILPWGMSFLPNTFVRCAGYPGKEHPCMYGFKITALNNDNTNEHVVVSKGVMMTKADADEAVKYFDYTGFWFIDKTSGKILYRNGNDWVDATGAQV